MESRKTAMALIALCAGHCGTDPNATDAFFSPGGTVTITVEASLGRTPNALDADVVETVNGPVGELTLALVPALFRDDESPVSGIDARRRTQTLAVFLGERHAEALFRSQGRIPHSWRRFSLVFMGTVRRGSGRGLYVPCIVWRQDRWHLHWRALDDAWRMRDRVVHAV